MRLGRRVSGKEWKRGGEGGFAIQYQHSFADVIIMRKENLLCALIHVVRLYVKMDATVPLCVHTVTSTMVREQDYSRIRASPYPHRPHAARVHGGTI